MIRLLIVDDDPSISRVIIEACALELPAEIETAMTGTDGLEKASGRAFDAIILDLTLPDLSGLEVCRGLRDRGIDVPVLCLTSRGEVLDRVLGLEMGADDYMTKPFSPRELIARLKAIWRRARSGASAGQASAAPESFEIGALRFDPASRRIFLSGAELELSRTEYDICFLLAYNRGKVFSRDELLQGILGYESTGYDQTITSHISRLRTKLGDDPESPRYIRTVRGVGYRFASPDEVGDESMK